MSTDNRNTLVVVALIVSMTLGALVLGALQPPRLQIERLTALSGTPIQTIQIEFVPDLSQVDATLYDCKVFPQSETAEWSQRGPDVRIAVIASSEAKLDELQKQTLLRALWSMADMAAVTPLPISYDPASQWQLTPALRAQAEELGDWLNRKGFVR